MIGLVQKNIGLKLLSLILSIMLWGFVKFTQIPFAAQVTQADVFVHVDVLTDPQMMALPDQDSVRVTLRGSKDSINALRPNSVEARLDLRGVPAGTIIPPVSVSQPPDLQLVGLTPERLTVRLEPVISQVVPVEVKVTGTPAKGFKLDNTTIVPPTVSVTGAQSFVSSVKQVTAEVNLTGIDTSLSQRVSMAATDAQGGTVKRVDLVPATTTVNMRILPEIVPRTLPVEPTFEGTLAHGLAVEAPTVKPALVDVVFQNSKAVVSSLTCEPINLDDVKAGVHHFEPKLVLPAGATLVSGKETTVQITLRVRAVHGARPKASKSPAKG